MLKIVAHKIIILLATAVWTTYSYGAFVPFRNLINPSQTLEGFLAPLRDYLFTKSHHAIRATGSPAHHRWEFNDPNNNIVHWTRSLEQSASAQNYIFQIYSEQTHHHLSFKLKYIGSLASETVFDLNSFQTMNWPEINPKQTLIIDWPTPELFQTRWEISDQDQWLSTWIAPAYNLELSLQRIGQLYIYRCSKCLRQPNGPSAVEAKAVVTAHGLNPRYYLDGQEVSANLFNQWINDVLLFTIKQSAEMFVHFFLAPNIFDELADDQE